MSMRIHRTVQAAVQVLDSGITAAALCIDMTRAADGGGKPMLCPVADAHQVAGKVGRGGAM